MIACRPLIDIGAGTSYISSNVINYINKKLITAESKRIEKLLSSSKKNIFVYSVEIKNIDDEFRFKTSWERCLNTIT